MRNFITSLLVLCFVTVYSQDQPAKINFEDGTSIQGFGEIKIKGSGFYKKYIIEFRASKEDKADEWDESMVKGITFTGHDEVYKFQYIIPGKREEVVLMEVMAEGSVSLYIDRLKMVTSFTLPVSADPDADNEEFQMPEIQEKDYVYVKRASEEYPTLLNGNYKKKAMAYFADCKSLVSRLEDNKYSLSTVQALVEFYNEYCIEN